MYLKKFLLLLGGLVVAWVLLESFALVVFYWRYEEIPSAARIAGRSVVDPADIWRASQGAEPQSPGVRNKTLHPYFGYGAHPRHELSNRFGFYGPEPIFQRAPDELVVGVFGGSLALGLVASAGEQIRQRLGAIPEFRGRDVRLVCLAVDGFKQPQSLLALNYLLSLGAVFDVVVNLDGFNDVVLPYTSNRPTGVALSFPRAWAVHSRSILDDTAIEQMGKVQATQRQMARLRNWLQRPPFRYSPFCLTLADIGQRRLRSRLFQQDRELRRIVDDKRPPSYAGPVESYADDREFFEEAVAVWGRSSRAMAQLCRANAIAYFHFLQPNQYHSGSKPLSTAERETAIAPEDTPLKTAVTQAYPLLIEQGKLLAQSGVDFVDLTQVFADEKRTLYVDPCCHVNELGYEILALRIVESIREQQPVSLR